MIWSINILTHDRSSSSHDKSDVRDIVPIAYEYRCSRLDDAIRTIKLIGFEWTIYKKKRIDYVYLFQFIEKPSSLSNVDKPVRHSVDLNVLGSINWTKSCIDIMANKHSRKCYKEIYVE